MARAAPRLAQILGVLLPAEPYLTLEFSAGERIDSYAKLHPDAMPRAMNTLVRLMLQTIFEEGLFHADPHPGNVFILPDGRLYLLDFGNPGEFVLSAGLAASSSPG